MHSSKVIFIPKGSTNSIISYLNKSGYELNFIDKAIIRFLGYPQQGWIDLKAQYMTKGDFLHKLTNSKAALQTVTLIPGETSYFFIKDLAKTYGLSESKLQKAYEKYAFKNDGNILAESYHLPIGMSEENIIYYLINYTSTQYERISQKIFGEFNQEKWYYYISIASVIQKEAANIEEMPYVSSVVHNRLKKGMPLQMDGTLNYGEYSHDRITARRLKEDKSSYNTYINKGVPNDPVCAVSLDAIKAAIFPARTNYLYFVRDKTTGKHSFSSTYKQHVNSINKNIQYIKTQPKTKPAPAVKTQKSEPKTEETSIFDKVKSESSGSTIKNLWKSVN